MYGLMKLVVLVDAIPIRVSFLQTHTEFGTHSFAEAH